MLETRKIQSSLTPAPLVRINDLDKPEWQEAVLTDGAGVDL